jgi:hypothetical protein
LGGPSCTRSLAGLLIMIQVGVTRIRGHIHTNAVVISYPSDDFHNLSHQSPGIYCRKRVSRLRCTGGLTMLPNCCDRLFAICRHGAANNTPPALLNVAYVWSSDGTVQLNLLRRRRSSLAYSKRARSTNSRHQALIFVPTLW